MYMSGNEEKQVIDMERLYYEIPGIARKEDAIDYIREFREALDGIRFRLPCGRLLSDEESQKEDDAEIGAAIRMAILLLSTAGRSGAAARIEVACDDRGPTYAVYAEGGEIEDSGADWGPLVRRLETVLGGETDAVSVIWP